MTEIAPIAVLLVDDQPAVLWGLEKLISGEWPRMMVAGNACDRDAALRLAATVQPDVILLDLDLAGELSLDFLPELLSLSQARVLILTCLRDRALHERALQGGASGVVLKDEPAQVLLEAIASVSNSASRQPATCQAGHRAGEKAELP
jgi:two-component system nitrate/nitrite response regulator NarL